MVMFANSSIIGDLSVGDHVDIGAHVLVKTRDLADNSVVLADTKLRIMKRS